MSVPSTHHMELIDGEGKCSCPMFSGMNIPDGFCDKPAYGTVEDRTRYRGHVPGLACYRHGGPAYNAEKRLLANVREFGT